MTALFVQPHLDDVALSVGGTVALAVEAGEDPVIVTVFSATPGEAAPLSALARELHRRWGGDAESVWETRRREDRAAAAVLGARTWMLDHLDAIYRGDHYASVAALRGPPVAEDAPLLAIIVDELEALARDMSATQVYLPLGVGGHVDHRLVHAAGANLVERGIEVWYYEDFPYVTVEGALEDRQRELASGLVPMVVDIRTTVSRRIAAIEKYTSQIPTLFRADGPFPGPFERLLVAEERFWKEERA